MLRDADEEAVDDVGEEFQEEVQDDEYGGLVDTDAREPGDGEGMEQTLRESENHDALNGAQAKRNTRKAIRIGGKEKRYPCDQPDCIKMYSSAQNLKQHIQIVHKKERPFKCIVTGCSKNFGYNYSLKMHMAVVHIANETFKCNCGKIFGSKQHLESHQRSAGHGKEKLACNYAKCTAAFSSSCNLSRHIRSVHLEDEPFICLEQSCGKKYTEKRNLENHLRSAHGAPKLVCKQSNCAQTFAYDSKLCKHMKKSH